MTTDELRTLHAYHRWASERVSAAAAGLTREQFVRPLASSFGSVRDTLVHLCWADGVWLSRWKGEPVAAASDPGAFPDAGTLRRRWTEVQGDAWAFLDGRSDADLARPVVYTNLRGQPDEAPLGVLVSHLVNHGSYHRGQLVTLMRQLGLTDLPTTDLIAYWRQARGTR